MDAFSPWVDVITQVLQGGFRNVLPAATGALNAMIGFAAAMLGVTMMIGNSGQALGTVGPKLLHAGALSAGIQAIPTVTNWWMNAMLQIGSMAGGSNSFAPDSFMKSANVMAARGGAIANGLFDNAQAVCDRAIVFGCLGVFDAWAPMWIAAWIVMLMFQLVGVAIVAFATVYLFAVIYCSVMAPFQLFELTRPYGMGGIRYLVHSGVKVGMLIMSSTVVWLGWAMLLKNEGTRIAMSAPGTASTVYYTIGILMSGAVLLGAHKFADSVASGMAGPMGGLFGAYGMASSFVGGGSHRMNSLAERGMKNGALLAGSGAMQLAQRVRAALPSPASKATTS